MFHILSRSKRMLHKERQRASCVRENFMHSCMSKDSCSVQRENNPLGQGVRSPIVRIAGQRETEVLESIGKYMESMYASIAGGNESERRNGLESENPRKPSQQPCGEGSMENRKLNETIETFRRGYSGGMHTRTQQRTGEALLVPCRNEWKKVSRITGNTGKSTENERVADELVVAMKRGNACGVKRLCCCESSDKTGGWMR